LGQGGGQLPPKPEPCTPPPQMLVTATVKTAFLDVGVVHLTMFREWRLKKGCQLFAPKYLQLQGSRNSHLANSHNLATPCSCTNLSWQLHECKRTHTHTHTSARIIVWWWSAGISYCCLRCWSVVCRDVLRWAVTLTWSSGMTAGNTRSRSSHSVLVLMSMFMKECHCVERPPTLSTLDMSSSTVKAYAISFSFPVLLFSSQLITVQYYRVGQKK